MTDSSIKHQVSEFYNLVGWQMTGDDTYQNARYEDLRPVSREYIHRCHLRVKRHLAPTGRFLLDAGSGPVQYPEYLTYSSGYQRRVCLDISIVALREARKRIGEHGLYVVADVACLPFKAEAFDGLVSLHTLHHLPSGEQGKAYGELYRVLAEDRAGVVVNGWTDSPLMRRAAPVVRLFERLETLKVFKTFRVFAGGERLETLKASETSRDCPPETPVGKQTPTGTFIQKLDAAWLRRVLAGRAFEIRVWRSVSVRFLRAVIHAPFGGLYWLKLLFFLEERFPRWFGEKGQYPLVIIRK